MRARGKERAAGEDGPARRAVNDVADGAVRRVGLIDGVLERLTGSPTAREHAPGEHAPGERQASARRAPGERQASWWVARVRGVN
jgi:hypothetical protein